MKPRRSIEVLLPGKATHYLINTGSDFGHANQTACGMVAPEYWAYDPRDCNCLRCMKTKKYKAVLK